jgi:hypothetical protein
MDTTRRFPRSTRECFRDAEYACAIEAHEVPLIDRIGGILLACLIGAGLAVALVAWWSN